MLNVNEVKTLYLGVQGENLAQTIRINVAPWLVAHPGGSVSIWHKRNGDEVPSATGATFDSATGIVSWSPTSTDTYVDGEGDAEIRLTVGSVIKKSRSVKTTVSPAVTLAGTPTGSGWQDYIDAVDGMKSSAETAMETAAQWATGGTTGTPGATNNAKYFSEQAEDSAEDAEAWAIGTDDTTHPAYQNSAKDHADDAADAQTAAEIAQGLAETAQGKAEDAQIAAEAAQGLAETAQEKAESWATGGSSGTPSATNNAKYYSEQASSSAGTASNKATEAATSATKAENWATGSSGGTASATNNAKYYSEQAAAAQTAAETAQGAAEAWATGGSSGTPSATNNSKYYSEVSEAAAETAVAALGTKADKVESATSGNFAGLDGNGNLTDSGHKHSDYLTAHQDISGKADKVASATNGNFAGLDSNGNLTDSGSKAADFVNASDFYATEMPVSSSDSTKVSAALASQKADIEELESSKADAIEVTDSTPASVMTFSDGGDGYPLSATFEIAPVQAGSGDPSPTNVRPITGWTGCVINRAGTNLLNNTALKNAPSETVDSYQVPHVLTFHLEKNTDYVLSSNYNNSGKQHQFYFNGTSSSDSVALTPKVRNSGSSGILKVLWFSNKTGASEFANDSVYLKLEKGAEATAFNGYATQVPVTFPAGAGTVYGGTLTVNKDGTGKLVVDRATESITGTETFSGTATSVGALYAADNKFNKFKTSTTGVDLCDTYPAVTAANTNSMADKTIARQNTTNNRLFIKDSQFANMTSSQLETYFTSNPVQYCGKLVTPVEYTLTATEVGQILSLLGTNNLFCDTGDVLSVNYIADTKIHVGTADEINTTHISSIFGMIAETEEKTATTNHTAGEVFILQTHIGVYTNSILVKATGSIASGDTITVGTNVEMVTLVEYIQSLID